MPKTIAFGGLTICVENPAGSTRSGVGPDGKPWSTTMLYPYGEIRGTMGIDGDPVDCFVNTKGPKQWVFVVHQTNQLSGGWDEDKVMLGFNDAMEAKEAYFKHYTSPEHFYGTIEAISFSEFKKKVLESKRDPQMIHASKIEAAIQMYAQAPAKKFSIGEQVLVDGLRGRLYVQEILPDGRLKLRARSGLWVTRNPIFVHKFDEGEYKNRYMTTNVRSSDK